MEQPANSAERGVDRRASAIYRGVAALIVSPPVGAAVVTGLFTGLTHKNPASFPEYMPPAAEVGALIGIPLAIIIGGILDVRRRRRLRAYLLAGLIHGTLTAAVWVAWAYWCGWGMMSLVFAIPLAIPMGILTGGLAWLIRRPDRHLV